TSKETTTTSKETTTTSKETTTTSKETTTTSKETTTTTESSTEPTETTTSVIGYTYEVTGKDKFYFSHDPRPFSVEDLIERIIRYALYSDGTTGEAEVVSDWTTFDIAFDVDGWRNPKEVFDTQVLDENGNVRSDYEYRVCYIGSVPVTIDGQVVETNANAYIAVKGDVTLDGVPNALDAAEILVYAAAKGAGNDAYLYSEADQILEYFSYFLGDVTGESKNYGEDGSDLNAIDAANILVYAANKGAGLRPKWEEVLAAPLPYYTYEIAKFNGTLPKDKE
ncbi:MAG: hypothetical protein IKL00_04275, partial [Oscillospiraceae bacterium]|nr:hypothetical protein [Oscillospiraceae bacterium]